MRARAIAIGLSLCLLLQTVGTSAAAGGGHSSSGGSRGGSSGGRSYSSGSSSRSFSSSSSSSRGRSYASGSSSSSRPSASASSSSSSGRSYSSGQKSSSPNPVRPPTSAAAPSSPRTNPSPSQKPTGTAYDKSAAGAAQKADSQKLYNTRTNPGLPASPPTTRPMPTGGKSYASGDSPGAIPPRGRTYASGTASTRTGGQRPAGTTFDANAGMAQRQAESRAAYRKGQQARTEYRDPTGVPRTIDPRDQTISILREQLDHERWVNRVQRERDFYTGYWSRPVVYYHDPFSSLFWWWLLDQSLDRRAYWAYHYHDVMDPARYRDLLARDAQLEARIRQLEAQGVQREPTRPVEGIDLDLMYTDDYVDAVYNPEPTATMGGPTETTTSTAPPPAADRPAHASHAGRVLFKIFLITSLVALAIWLVFFKRWGSSP